MNPTITIYIKLYCIEGHIHYKHNIILQRSIQNTHSVINSIYAPNPVIRRQNYAALTSQYESLFGEENVSSTGVSLRFTLYMIIAVELSSSLNLCS